MEVLRGKKTSGQAGEKTEVVERTVSHTTSDASNEQRTVLQNVKRYRKVAWVTFGLTSAILLFGYDNVVVGTTSGMPAFQYIYIPPLSRLSHI